LKRCSPARLDSHFLKAGKTVFLLVFISFLIITPDILAKTGKNYVYRMKNGKLLLTDRPQKADYADLVQVFEARKEQFFIKYGEYYRNKYDTLVQKYSMLNGLDPELVHAVIQVESGYDYTAVSPAGAKGLMQLMDYTANDLGVMNVFDPRENIRAGTVYLSKMMDKYEGNLDFALAAYNAGPTAVDRYKGVPAYKETKNYIKRIKKLLNGEAIVPKYTYEQMADTGKEKKTNLTWDRVNGKVVIKSQNNSSQGN
jgi:ribosomal protein S30